MLRTPETDLHVDVRGAGRPVTLFAHGIASSSEDVRFLGSGVPGTRAFLDFRGHGRSGTPAGGDDAWGYPAVTRDLVAAARHVDADRAVGVSLGAGAILGAIEADPTAFSRVVLLLPAALDRVPPADPGSDLAEMARLADAGDVAGLERVLARRLPPDIGAARGVAQLMQRRAAAMCRPGLARAIGALPHRAPVSDRGALSAYGGKALVIAHEGDDEHPVAVAHEVADALRATLHVFAQPWSMLRERAALRDLLTGFLTPAE